MVTPFGSRNDRVPFYNNFTTFSLHIRVLYWAIATMSSMGYANAPVPIADIDYCYAIMTQVVGACLAAAIFSNIAQMINKGDAAGARYQAQLDQIREYSKLQRLKPHVSKKLYHYKCARVAFLLVIPDRFSLPSCMRLIGRGPTLGPRACD